jgi:phospholipid/cholesterol/gamma-HCH transport system substrate-binding protein
MSAQRQALLGLFFVLVFGVLGWFTLFKGDLGLFRERVLVTVHFEQAGGLREGDSVLVAGLRWGEIESLNYDPQRAMDERIEVVLSLEQTVQLFEDHVIQIEDSTVLGGKQLVIEPGQAGSGPVSLEGLHGKVAPNVMKALGDLVEDNRGALSNILTGLETMVGDVQGGEGVLTRLLYDEQLAENLSNAVSSVAATFENAEALTRDLRLGEGTLGKLMSDPELYGQIKGIATGIEDFVGVAQQVVDDVRAGKGTVGMLLYDEEVSADVKQAIDRLAKVIDDLEQGRGTLGLLLKDPSIGENIAKITSDLAEGRGTIGRLLLEDDVYDNLLQVTADLKTASAALRDGQGTIGRLLYEDELYVELERAVKTLTGTLEEAREAAPIATFLNTVFLGF